VGSVRRGLRGSDSIRHTQAEDPAARAHRVDVRELGIGYVLEYLGAKMSGAASSRPVVFNPAGSLDSLNCS
jgi:hypothetical protein